MLLARAPIGSLYQFFPNKEALADALLERFAERLDQALLGIEYRAKSISIHELAEELLGLLIGFREERAAASALMDVVQQRSNRAAEIRQAHRRHVARILKTRFPKLSLKRAEIMGLVVVHLMKAAARQSTETDPAVNTAVMKELKQALTLYLGDQLSSSGDSSR